MRTSRAVLLAVVVAGLVWFLLDGTPRSSDPSQPPPSGNGPEEGPERRITTGTLIVRVEGPDGSVPAGAEVGYVFEDRPRYAYVNEAGRHTFTDAPLGPLEVIARAPGYEGAKQARTLLRGVPMTVLLTLQPRR